MFLPEVNCFMNENLGFEEVLGAVTRHETMRVCMLHDDELEDFP